MHKEPFDPDVLARELFDFVGPRYEARSSFFDLEDGRQCIVIEERSGAEVVITIERREGGRGR